MREFNPTHEFQGLELRFHCKNGYYNGRYVNEYRTREGDLVALSEGLATKIQPKPKPGEVWRYDDPDEEVGSFLVVIASDGEGFRTEEDPYETMYSGDLEHMTKVLNADGSPA